MSTTERPVFNDRYEIHSRIGRGGMADVFLARDRLLDRPVAVKVLFPEYATDPSFVERFRREAQAAANLNHPNIVGVYDWGRQSGTYFIVMEYVNGRSLADLLKADGPLPAQRATDIAFDVAGALGFAHRNGVVHRDVKPGNILVAPTGAVKVADFGIARALNSSTEADLTQAGAVMGTATYFSPEQAQGANPDPRSDLYSLGVVLYEMVSGKPPFTGDNPVAIAYRQVHDTPQPLSSIRSDVPKGYEAITMKLLAKSPSSRYASAEDLRTDLRRFRDGQQPAALTPTSGTDLTTVNTSARVDPAAAQATAVVRQPPVPATQVVPAAQVTRVQPSQVIEPRRPAGPPPDLLPYERERRPGWVIPVVLLLLAGLGAGGFYLYKTLSDTGTKTPVETIPLKDVRGLTVEEARAQLQALNLYSTTEAKASEGVPVGQVYATEPAPGTAVPKNSTVKLIYNPAPETFPVPFVVGLTQEEAQKTLADQELLFTVTPQNDDTQPAGKVLSQDPPQGTAVPKGTTVKLTVSAGKGQIEVPTVVGLDALQASNQLGAKGFQVVEEQANSDTVPAGKVIGTDPPALTMVDKGSQVKLIVSIGAPPVAVPDLVGLSQQDAFQKIQEGGFLQGRPTECSVPYQDPRDGKIFSQTPPAGSKAPKGSTISICIAKAEPAPTTTTAIPTTTTTIKTTTTVAITVVTSPPTVPKP